MELKSKKIIQTFYISTGRKNAMYTLRMRRVGEYAVRFNGWGFDHYIRNLAATIDKAQEKAQEYFDAWKSRVGESPTLELHLDLDPDIEVGKRRGKLSINETRWLDSLENGVFPFGKNAGKPIDSAEDGYLLFFADKLINDPNLTPIMYALSAACMGVALERDLIAKRETKRQEKLETDKKSNYIGNVGDRLVLDGTINSVFFKENYDMSFYINRIKCGDDIVVYIGKKLGEKGENIKFKATVFKHSEYKDVKSTQVKRPAIIKN